MLLLPVGLVLSMELLLFLLLAAPADFEVTDVAFACPKPLAWYNVIGKGLLRHDDFVCIENAEISWGMIPTSNSNVADIAYVFIVSSFFSWFSVFQNILLWSGSFRMNMFPHFHLYHLFNRDLDFLSDRRRQTGELWQLLLWYFLVVTFDNNGNWKCGREMCIDEHSHWAERRALVEKIFFVADTKGTKDQ